MAGLREQCPKVRILVRAQDRIHEIDLLDEDIDFIVRETFESSVDMATQTLRFLGMNEGMIGEVENEFRDRDRRRLLAQKAEGIYAGREELLEPLPAVERGAKEPAGT